MSTTAWLDWLAAAAAGGLLVYLVWALLHAEDL